MASQPHRGGNIICLSWQLKRPAVISLPDCCWVIKGHRKNLFCRHLVLCTRQRAHNTTNELKTSREIGNSRGHASTCNMNWHMQREAANNETTKLSRPRISSSTIRCKERLCRDGRVCHNVTSGNNPYRRLSWRRVHGLGRQKSPLTGGD